LEQICVHPLPPLPPPSPVLHPLHTNHQQYWLHKRRQLQRLEKIGLRKINREKEKLTMLVVLVACPPGCSTRTPSRRRCSWHAPHLPPWCWLLRERGHEREGEVLRRERRAASPACAPSASLLLVAGRVRERERERGQTGEEKEDRTGLPWACCRPSPAPHTRIVPAPAVEEAEVSMEGRLGERGRRLLGGERQEREREGAREKGG
jgi:hypothetical protein